jgi:hypothetical protein
MQKRSGRQGVKRATAKVSSSIHIIAKKEEFAFEFRLKMDRNLIIISIIF